MFFDDCDKPGVTNQKECNDYWNSIGKPPEECLPGQTGTPPNCEMPPPGDEGPQPDENGVDGGDGGGGDTTDEGRSE
jgi:hypothetical protein